MRLETLFEKFDLIADAPGAVAKMRELVLELAVHGQLSERNPEDQNDPAWQAFLEELDNRIHGNDPGPPPPFDIPNEWRWVCVDDVADACGQKRPDEPFTYIDVASIDNQCGIIKSDLEVLTPENAPSRARKLVRLGAVIYATVRPYLKNIAIIDREFSPPAIVSTAFAVLHPRPFVDARFLFYWLRSKPFEVAVAERMKGVAYPAINDGEFRSCPVPLPPLAEQKRIVAKVDELMALCDRLEAQQQERDTRHAALVRASLARFTEAPTPANLEFLFHPSYDIPPADLRKTILTLAVQGKLVPQDPNDEPVAQLLKRILAEKKRRTGRSERFDEEAGLSPNDEPFEIPENWEWIYATTPAIMVSDQGKKIQTKDILEFGKYPVVDQGKMFIRGYCDDPEKVIRIDGPIVLFGDHTRETKFIDFDFVVGADGVKLLQPICIDPRYYFWVLRSLPLESRGYARHFKLLKTSRIPLPPLAEQKRIVAKVEQLMALVAELEQQLAASRATAEKLLTALVAGLVNAKNAHASAEV